MSDHAADVIGQIGRASTPADLFGTLPPGGAKRRYRDWQVLLHPDRNPGSDEAAQAYARLTGLWRDWQRPEPDVIHGDVADLFTQPGGLLKMPREARDNDLMAREVSALRMLREVPGAMRVFFPELVSTQRQRDPATGIIRRVSLLKPLDGFVTLADVKAAYPQGVHPRDVAWMWRRLLTALGAAHEQGIIHGAVLPPHVMIHPDQHGLVLVDWCYSAVKDQKIPALVSTYRDWYPHEVAAKRTPVPATDIYMAAKIMRDLLGDYPAAPLRAFANGCLLPSRKSRPQDAWVLLAEFDDLLERLFGPPAFHPFTMPARA